MGNIFFPDICGVSSVSQTLHPVAVPSRNCSLACWQLQKSSFFSPPNWARQEQRFPWRSSPGFGEPAGLCSHSSPNFPPTKQHKELWKGKKKNSCCHIYFFPLRKRRFVKISPCMNNIWWRGCERLMSTCFLSIMSKHLVWMFLFSFDFYYSDVGAILL